MEGKGMALKLLIDNGVEGTANRPVSWCLEKKDLEYLEKNDIPKDNVQVLIVVAYEDGFHEDRYLAPLDSPMARVGFSYAGNHKVFARLVWPCGQSAATRKNVAKMRNQIRQEDSPHDYHFRVLDYDRDGILNYVGLDSISNLINGIEAFEISVVVDKEHFAKEPSAWLKRWVNLWFSYKQRDECSFFWRGVLAFTIQPIPMALLGTFLFLKNLVLWFVSQVVLGLRGVKHSLLLHPWRTDSDEFFPKVNLEKFTYGSPEVSSWYYEDSDGTENPRRLLMNPLVLAVVFLLINRFYLFMMWVSISTLLWIGKVVVGTLLMGLIAYYLAGKFMDAKAAKSKSVKKQEVKAEQTLVTLRGDYDELKASMTCSAEKSLQGPPNPDLIPKEKLTLHLRVANYKAKGCRRYQG